MLRFENYFCCLFNCYFIFCSYVLLSVLSSHLTKNRVKKNLNSHLMWYYIKDGTG